LLANLVELHKDFDGEPGGQLPAGDHVVQCLGEAVMEDLQYSSMVAIPYNTIRK
jgi:hypothetical protein